MRTVIADLADLEDNNEKCQLNKCLRWCHEKFGPVSQEFGTPGNLDPLVLIIESKGRPNFFAS